MIVVSSPTLIAVVALTACSEKSDDTGSTTASLKDCTPDQLDTVSDGTLTIGTDKPAYEPYFVDDDPANGKGFESALGYAIADKLGFEPDQVEWTVVPFNASYAPGPKDFDFDVNQVSITDKRAKGVDFSSSYYEADQAILALPGTLPDDLTTLGDLADVKFGVQIGTTSYDALVSSIDPNEDPATFDNSNDVVTALQQKQVDAIVVDTPTAFILKGTKVPEAEIVGEFAAPEGDEWGAVLQKDSSLTGCVSAAIDSLRDSGELEQLQKKWINTKSDLPFLE